MTPEAILALAGFSVVAAITPGPNNLMLLASGANFGLARTIPHMLGVAGGFGILLTSVGLGLGQILGMWPTAFLVLKFACALYLAYLAWRIATAGSVGKGEVAGRPFSFLQAAAFQWVNPKAWFMAITAIAVYAVPDRYTSSVVVIVALFVLCSVPCNLLWCGLGTGMRRWLSDPWRLRAFNWTMAGLLLLSVLPMIAGG